MCEQCNIFLKLYNVRKQRVTELCLYILNHYYAYIDSSDYSDCCRSSSLACKYLCPHGSQNQEHLQYSCCDSCCHLVTKGVWIIDYP